MAWEASSVVNRVVIGGLPRTDPDEEIRSAVLAAAGQDPAERPELARFLRAISDNLFTGSNPPTVPSLIAYGEKDDIAADAPALAATVPGARVLSIPGRTHMNAVSARVFKEAALEMLSSS
jgi:pimeloyl-ACP methyl ester carboxylesterase